MPFGSTPASDAAAPPAASARSLLLGEGRFRFGEAVTHLERGVAVLEGLEEVSTPAGEETFIRLRFADEAVLIPATEAGKLFRFGLPGDLAPLDDAGGDWAERAEAIEAEVRDLTLALKEKAAARARVSAPVIEADQALLGELTGGFGHELTPGQEAAQSAVISDLMSGRPMNRLIVADTGYGKTEIALRAAALAARAGHQVAVMAPTTILCRQHADLFRRRLEPLGIAVEELCGHASEADAAAIRARLESGETDVVVGTHALSGDAVAFHRLGLVVIDEEQRLGTERKEDFARDVHALTLTATPIPRTLAAAEAGLVELSVIDTPPPGRRATATRRGALTKPALRRALSAELDRSGQAFVVAPLIADLDALLAKIEAVLPNAQVAVAHGQLRPDEIEAAMNAFASGEADILLSTAIVESGVDVPRAGCMIVAGADRFGLAQLHQLRGRVGRDGQEGACWLLTRGKITEEADTRLDTLCALSEVGAGFALAARDLALRGAGEADGDEQTGHGSRLGLELYRHLVRRALAEAEGRAAERVPPDLGACGGGHLPASCMDDPEDRLNLRIEIARATSGEAIDALRDALGEGGALPEPARRLFRSAELSLLCRAAGVSAVDAGPAAVALRFYDGKPTEKALRALTGEDAAAFGTPKSKEDKLILGAPEGRDPCDAAYDLVSLLASAV